MADETAAVKQNEQALGEFIDQADKKFVGQAGIMALALLTEQMEPQQYKQLLSECIENAMQMHRFKMLNGKSPKAEDSQSQ
jgi:hypothetical protein